MARKHRELENVIERTVILSSGSTLEVDPLMLSARIAVPANQSTVGKQPDAARPDDDALSKLDEGERRHIVRTLKRVPMGIDGSEGAAKILGVHPSPLRGRMKKLGIRRTNEAAS